MYSSDLGCRDNVRTSCRTAQAFFCFCREMDWSSSSCLTRESLCIFLKVFPLAHRERMNSKDMIEIMKWTLMKNETSHKFRKFLALFFRIFPALFVKISIHFATSWTSLWNSIKKSSIFRRKITTWSHRKNVKKTILHFLIRKHFDDVSLKFWDMSSAKIWKSCRSRKIWKNAPALEGDCYLRSLAIVAVDTADNEPLKISRWFHSFFESSPYFLGRCLVFAVSSPASLPFSPSSGWIRELSLTERRYTPPGHSLWNCKMW